jgi:hypothetical protein
MDARDRREASDDLAEKWAESGYLDDLPVEGWFWELVRRDERFRERFDRIAGDAEEYAASAISRDEYARRLKNYLAHLRRYGVKVCAAMDPDALRRLLRADCYLFLPLPNGCKVVPVPRPDVAYPAFGEGLKPGSLRVDLPKPGFTRVQIRKLLSKYGLLEKGGERNEPR